MLRPQPKFIAVLTNNRRPEIIMNKNFFAISVLFFVIFLIGCVAEESVAIHSTTVASVDANIGWIDASRLRNGADTNKVTETGADIDSGYKDVDIPLPDPCADKVCQDNNPCTTDVCYMGQCQYTAIPLEEWVPCDDGNPCTYPDACIYGECNSVGKVNCDDKNPCTTDACTGKPYNDKNACMHTNNSSPCDDGNACTIDENCQDGGCNSEKNLVCDDGNPCTTDSCSPEVGCENFFVDNTVLCDDNNACSFMDHCEYGKCKGVQDACDDFNPCTTDSCDKFSGNCEHTPIQDGTTCDDQNGCTEVDLCKKGVCAGTVPMYGSESKDPDNNTFTCVPCQTDTDCEFKSKTFCISSGGGPGGPYSNPVPVLKPTGKCVANACEFKKDFCNDGDYTTIDSCSPSLGSTYPLYKAGECKHKKITEEFLNFYISECWCKDQDTLECVKATANGDGFTVQSDVTKFCPNGCGWNCL